MEMSVRRHIALFLAFMSATFLVFPAGCSSPRPAKETGTLIERAEVPSDDELAAIRSVAADDAAAETLTVGVDVDEFMQGIIEDKIRQPDNTPPSPPQVIEKTTVIKEKPTVIHQKAASSSSGDAGAAVAVVVIIILLVAAAGAAGAAPV